MLSGKYIYAVNSSGTEEKYPLWTDTDSSTGTHFLAYKDSESSTVSNSVWLSIQWNSSSGSYQNVSSVYLTVHLLNSCKSMAKITQVNASNAAIYTIYVGSGLTTLTYNFPSDWALFTGNYTWKITVNGTETTIPTRYITRRIYNTSTENTTTLNNGGYYSFSYTDNGIRYARLADSGLSLKAYAGSSTYYVDNTTTFQCKTNSNSCPTTDTYSCSSYDCTGVYYCTSYTCPTTDTCSSCYNTSYSCPQCYNTTYSGCSTCYNTTNTCAQCYNTTYNSCTQCYNMTYACALCNTTSYAPPCTKCYNTSDTCSQCYNTTYNCTQCYNTTFTCKQCYNTTYNCTQCYNTVYSCARCYTTNYTCNQCYTSTYSCPSVYNCPSGYGCDSTYTSCNSKSCLTSYGCPTTFSCTSYACGTYFSCSSNNTCSSVTCGTSYSK